MKHYLPILLLALCCAAVVPKRGDRFPHKTVEMPVPAKKAVSPMPVLSGPLATAEKQIAVAGPTKNRSEVVAAATAALRPPLKVPPKPSISLRWDYGDQRGIRAFKVAGGSSSDDYTALWEVAPQVTNTITVSNLDIHQSYVFRVQAQSTNGQVSAWSSEVYFNVAVDGRVYQVGGTNELQFPLFTGKTVEVHALANPAGNWSTSPVIYSATAQSNALVKIDRPVKSGEFYRLKRN